MRNSMFLLVALGGFAMFSLPAAADSDEGSCAAPSSVAPSGPIDLEAIPMKDASGPKSIGSAGVDDDCDDQTPGRAALGSDVEDHGPEDDD